MRSALPACCGTQRTRASRHLSFAASKELAQHLARVLPVAVLVDEPPALADADATDLEEVELDAHETPKQLTHSFGTRAVPSELVQRRQRVVRAVVHLKLDLARFAVVERRVAPQ